MSPACYSNVTRVGKVAIWLLWSRSTHYEHTGMINQSNNCSFTRHKGSVNGSKIKVMWTVQCCAIVYLYTTVCEYNAWKPQGDLDLKLRPVTKSHIIGFTSRGPMSISSPSVVPFIPTSSGLSVGGLTMRVEICRPCISHCALRCRFSETQLSHGNRDVCHWTFNLTSSVILIKDLLSEWHQIW